MIAQPVIYETGNTTKQKTNERTAISPHVSLERQVFGYFCELSNIPVCLCLDMVTEYL